MNGRYGGPIPTLSERFAFVGLAVVVVALVVARRMFRKPFPKNGEDFRWETVWSKAI